MRATVRRRVGRVGIAGTTAGMLAFTLALMLAATGAAANDTDDALRQAVERRLADEAAVADRVEVSVRSGEVTLAGTLATLWDKEWAIERARGTDGVLDVMSDLIIGMPETDKELGNAVGQAIVRYPYYSVFDYVDVTVEDGVVTLRGDVTARPDKPADLYERISKVRGCRRSSTSSRSCRRASTTSNCATASPARSSATRSSTATSGSRPGCRSSSATAT